MKVKPATGKVLVAMSGGVDSSATALLLRQQGYDCVGVTMRLHDAFRSPGQGSAPAAAPAAAPVDADAQDARRIAERLDMPFEVLDCREAFEANVVAPFVDEYAHGRTPNPCIFCNRRLKFGLLFEYADKLGCTHVATGHYARIQRGADGRFHLRCGADPKKDQSYVLYALAQWQLARVLLPLGDLGKDEVRALARQSGLAVSEKQESQDICFIPDGDYAGFLRSRGVTGAPGAFLDQAGTVVGEHRGIEHYTIGQRKGLGLALGEPVYVTGIDAEANTVTVGPRDALARASLRIEDVVWNSGSTPQEPFRAEVRTHYHAPRIPVRVVPGETSARIEALGPLRAVAPGQAAVLYQGDEVIGGGTICQ